MGEEGVIILPAEDDIEKTTVEAITETAAGAFTQLSQVRRSARRSLGSFRARLQSTSVRYSPATRRCWCSDARLCALFARAQGWNSLVAGNSEQPAPGTPSKTA